MRTTIFEKNNKRFFFVFFFQTKYTCTSVMKKPHRFFSLKQPYRVWYQIKAKNKSIAVTFVDLLFFEVRRCQNKQTKIWYTRLFMSFIAIGK